MLVSCVAVPEIGIVCERMRNPHLAGRPLILAADKKIVAISEEASRSAIRPGQSAGGAAHLCPDLTELPYDAPYYREAARVFWDALAVESSTVEPVSAEHCFAAMSGSESEIVERLSSLACTIAKRASMHLHVGLARTKLLSFHAAREALPCRVRSVALREESSFLAPIAIAGLTQLPPHVRDRLLRLGVHTIGELQRIPSAELERQFRTDTFYVSRLAAGDDGEPVRADWPPPAIEETFRFDSLDGGGDEEIDKRYIEHALRCCAGRLAERLDEQQTRCRCVKLTIRCSNNETLHQEEPFERGISCRKLLFAAGLRLLARLSLSVPPSELVLTAADIGSGSAVQLGLLDERGIDYERDRRLKNTTAILRRQFGLAAVNAGIPVPPRQSMLFTHPLTHQRAEPVDVEVGEQDRPVRVSRLGSRGGVWDMPVSVRDLWKETKWLSGEPRECMTYRVESSEGGVFDLVHIGFDEWQLAAVAD